mmetsp:Transcript_39358/g.100904  ORF Transcript_39358/g.100904 Transcript_39358/m.100904 type:complete len:208 (+) Transcript_39358:395-1018(+)
MLALSSVVQSILNENILSFLVGRQSARFFCRAFLASSVSESSLIMNFVPSARVTIKPSGHVSREAALSSSSVYSMGISFLFLLVPSPSSSPSSSAWKTIAAPFFGSAFFKLMPTRAESRAIGSVSSGRGGGPSGKGGCCSTLSFWPSSSRAGDRLVSLLSRLSLRLLGLLLGLLLLRRPWRDLLLRLSSSESSESYLLLYLSLPLLL